MRLNHIALNIDNADEVADFYQNILGFELKYQFELPEELSRSVFGINQSLFAFFCKNKQVAFELFVVPEKTKRDVAHICLEVSNRVQLIFRCNNKGYKVNNVKREGKPDLLFIWDKAGNCFEIKNI